MPKYPTKITPKRLEAARDISNEEVRKDIDDTLDEIHTLVRKIRFSEELLRAQRENLQLERDLVSFLQRLLTAKLEEMNNDL